MNFLKELEVAHSLRHPNIVLYMGLSLDPVKNNAFIVHEFVSKASLFDILHGIRAKRRVKSKLITVNKQLDNGTENQELVQND